MQIYGPFRVSTSQAAGPTNRTSTNQTSSTPKPDSAPRPTSAPVDQLDLSSASGVNRLDSTGSVSGSGEIRLDRVADIRRQIADGSYETPEKLDAALDRLLDQIA